jgi:hypothetical protein
VLVWPSAVVPSACPRFVLRSRQKSKRAPWLLLSARFTRGAGVCCRVCHGQERLAAAKTLCSKPTNRQVLVPHPTDKLTSTLARDRASAGGAGAPSGGAAGSSEEGGPGSGPSAGPAPTPAGTASSTGGLTLTRTHPSRCCRHLSVSHPPVSLCVHRPTFSLPCFCRALISCLDRAVRVFSHQLEWVLEWWHGPCQV